MQPDSEVLPRATAHVHARARAPTARHGAVGVGLSCTRTRLTHEHDALNRASVAVLSRFRSALGVLLLSGRRSNDSAVFLRLQVTVNARRIPVELLAASKAVLSSSDSCSLSAS